MDSRVGTTGMNNMSGDRMNPDMTSRATSGMNSDAPSYGNQMSGSGMGNNGLNAGGMNSMADDRTNLGMDPSGYKSMASNRMDGAGMTARENAMTDGSSMPGMGGAGGLNNHPGTSNHHHNNDMNTSSYDSHTVGKSQSGSKVGQMIGKAEEKAGQMLHNPKLQAKGTEQRLASGDEMAAKN